MRVVVIILIALSLSYSACDSRSSWTYYRIKNKLKTSIKIVMQATYKQTIILKPQKDTLVDNIWINGYKTFAKVDDFFKYNMKLEISKEDDGASSSKDFKNEKDWIFEGGNGCCADWVLEVDDSDF